MTSVACHLGELTATSTRSETRETSETTANNLANSIVKSSTSTKTSTKTITTTTTKSKAASKTTTTRTLKVQPLEAWPLVGEFDVNRPLVGGRYNNGNLLALLPNRATCDQRQTRSGSSDSDQLSLLSSFGSLSLDAFQQFGSAAAFTGHQQRQRQRNDASPPSDSTSRQSMSLDLDQHQFHCSLMLLSSLDFNSNYERNPEANPAGLKETAATGAIVCHAGGKLEASNTSNTSTRSAGASVGHQQAVLASKTSSQNELSYHNHLLPAETSRHTPLNNHRNQQHKVGSLQDCRSHCWLPWNRLSRNQNSSSERADRHQIGPKSSVTSGGSEKRKSASDKDRRQAAAPSTETGGDTDSKAAARRATSSPGNKLLSVASRGFTRKMSTKEKCKRQKDAERVEKLRLLVNYLKRGSSQPIVSPVALEADEIELAERYKMHVISRDDILKDIQQSISNDQSQQDQQQQHQQYSGLSDRGRWLAAAGSSATSASTNELKRPDEAANALRTNSTSVINSSMVVAGTSSSTPASASSASSVNQHSAHNQNPRIGNVTWVLRHSISDPGNNFEHLPVFSMTSSSSSSSKEHKQCNHSHHHHHHHSQHLHSSHHSSTKDNSSSPGQHQQQAQLCHQQAQSGQLPDRDLPGLSADHLSTCAPSSSSYSGSSLSNYCLGSGSNGSGKLAAACGSAQNQQSSSNLEHQSPKMFYIDDMDMIPVCSSSSCLLNATNSQQTAATPQLAPVSALGQQQTSTPLTTTNSTTNCCSQPSTPVIYTNLAISNIMNHNNSNSNSNNNNTININMNNTNIACDSHSEGVGCESESSASSNKNNSPPSVQRTWTNPQNLATWIDNEVNSLVHDLEAKSQQLQIKQEGKHNKSGKKKWLSVTSSHSGRRSSSGAQST